MKNFLKIVFFLSCFMNIKALQGNELLTTFSDTQQHLTKKEKESVLFSHSPIGDNANTNVYFFIKDALLKKKALSKSEVEKWINIELEILKENGKTSLAGAYETELGHILQALCIANHCNEIILYQKNGLVIAIGSNEKQSTPVMDKRILDLDKIGSLAPKAESKLGIRTFSDEAGNVVKEITAAIYYKKHKDYAFLSFQTKSTEEGELIGYIRYVTQQ